MSCLFKSKQKKVKNEIVARPIMTPSPRDPSHVKGDDGGLVGTRVEPIEVRLVFVPIWKNGYILLEGSQLESHISCVVGCHCKLHDVRVRLQFVIVFASFYACGRYLYVFYEIFRSWNTH